MFTEFPNHEDLGITYRLLLEYGDRYYPLISYRKLILVPTEIDEIHGEIEDREKEFSDYFQVKGYVDTDQETHPHTRFGVERTRNAVLHISVPHMLAMNLAIQNPATKVITLNCATGDRFIYSDFEYDVLEVRRGKMWANTDIPLYFDFRAEKYRPVSTQFVGP